MNYTDWLTLFWIQIKETPFLQWVGVAFGVSEVLLAKANRVWLYPAGIISVTISIYVLFSAGLYAEALLNGYYLVMSIYGWWNWDRSDSDKPVNASYCSKSELLTALLITAISFGILYPSLMNFTDSDVPVWDAWVSATAWAGMWLLAKRKIENWIFLNVSNAFAVPLLLHKQLPLYAALTVFLFIVAVQGFFNWKNIIKSAES